MKKISIVIPVYNEAYFISGLLKSISKINYPSEDFEVIAVSDGSTDDTVSEINKYSFVRLIELKENLGRYPARKIGAEAAQYPNILFIDSRTVVDEAILAVINTLDEKIVVGRVLSVDKPGVFETFYNSIRRIVFSQFYTHEPKVMELNKENFDSLPKGTTVLFVQKDILFRAYEDLSNVHMGKGSSDDTKLIRAMVEHSPAIIHPGVKITGLYRKSFWESIKHLALYRGSTFVDYYFNPSKRNFWIVIVFPLVLLLGIIITLIFIPISGINKLAVLLLVDIFATLVLARTFREFYIILLMLPLCVVVFYFGIIRGILLRYKKELNKISRSNNS